MPYLSKAFDTSVNKRMWNNFAKYLDSDFRARGSSLEEDVPEFDLDYQEKSSPVPIDDEINEEADEQLPEDTSEQLSKCSDQNSTVGSCSRSHSRACSDHGKELGFRQTFLSECWDDQLVASPDRENRKFSGASEDLIDLICRLIDRTVIRLKDLISLPVQDRLILNNFLFSVHQSVFSFDMEDLAGQVDKLNELLTQASKKKRKEEKIKYTFKSINQILLSNFIKYENSKGEDSDSEAEDEKKNTKMRLIKKYFSKASKGQPIHALKSLEYYYKLLFQPESVNKTSFHHLMTFGSYKRDFTAILNKDYLSEFMRKRRSKIRTYIDRLQEELYYLPAASRDQTVLGKKVIKRLPWACDQMLSGIDILRTCLSMA